MRRFRLRLGEVVVETAADAAGTEALQAVLREAFLELGRLIQQTPFGRWVDTEELVLDTLELQALALDELLGPRGATRLAEQLYARLPGGWA